MKVRLTFDLPEEADEHRAALEGAASRMVLRDLAEWLRAKVKYEDHSAEKDEAYQDVREQLFAYLEDAGINLDR